MANHTWTQEFPGTITVCDPNGIILEMNAATVNAYQNEGGEKLIGTNLFDCHPEPSRTKLRRLMETQQTNVYTIEKKGVKKLVYQVPWYRDGEYCGFVELVMEIPVQMPHFIRS